MLTDGIAKAYRDGKDRFETRNAVRQVYTTPSAGREASPNLYETTADAYLQDHALGEEVFGPLGLIVRVASVEDMARLACGFEGQLTATLHYGCGRPARPASFCRSPNARPAACWSTASPTGVEVCDAMVHGGPYPASTNFGATSVGTMAIRRFLRPVSYQNFPEAPPAGRFAVTRALHRPGAPRGRPAKASTRSAKCHRRPARPAGTASRRFLLPDADLCRRRRSPARSCGRRRTDRAIADLSSGPSEIGADLPGHGRAVDQKPISQFQHGRARVEVERADEDALFVDGEGLGVRLAPDRPKGFSCVSDSGLTPPRSRNS